MNFGDMNFYKLKNSAFKTDISNCDCGCYFPLRTVQRRSENILCVCSYDMIDDSKDIDFGIALAFIV